MRPEDLKSPFTWKERRVCVEDKIWHVPPLYDRYQEFSFPGFEAAEFFGNNHPVCIEYCSGNGAWIAAKALENPNINWIALEKKFDRVRKIWAKVKNHGIENLVIICGEALLTTSLYFPSARFDRVFINFPDPWPKKRHEKNRLIQKPFVQEIERILKPSGNFTFVTDDEGYSDWTIAKLKESSCLKSSYPDPFFVDSFPGYGTSYFEDLWRAQGKKIRYHQYIKSV